MARKEALAEGSPPQDTATHVRDYERFITMFKWGAVGAFISGLIILLIIS